MVQLKTTYSDGDILFAGTTADQSGLNSITNEVNTNSEYRYKNLYYGTGTTETMGYTIPANSTGSYIQVWADCDNNGDGTGVGTYIYSANVLKVMRVTTADVAWATCTAFWVGFSGTDYNPAESLHISASGDGAQNMSLMIAGA